MDRYHFLPLKEPIVGVKLLEVIGTDCQPRLRTIVSASPWGAVDPGRAVCRITPGSGELGEMSHWVPSVNCTCGHHSWYPALGLELLRAAWYRRQVGVLVVGSGKIIRGTRAWRSEYIRMVAVIDSGEAGFLEELASSYGVALMTPPSVMEMASEFGRVLPSEFDGKLGPF
jgi:hypothetical protein